MVHITDDNQGPIVSIVTWILICAVLLVSTLKVSLAYASVGLHLDDILVIIATIFSIVHSAVVSVQVHYGLGRPQASLGPVELQHYQETSYTAQIFFILTLALTKMAVLAFLRQLTPDQAHRRAIHILGSFIGAGSFAALIAAFFQCSVPQTWAVLSNSCFNMTAFWSAFGCMNILSELFLIALPVYIIWYVRMDIGSKAIVVASFAMRIFVIAAAAVKIAFLQMLMGLGRSNLTFETWRYVLLTVIVQSLAVISVSIPSIKTIMMGLDSGMLKTGHYQWRSGHTKAMSQSRAVMTNKPVSSPVVLSQARHWPSSNDRMDAAWRKGADVVKLPVEESREVSTELEVLKVTHISVEVSRELPAESV